FDRRDVGVNFAVSERAKRDHQAYLTWLHLCAFLPLHLFGGEGLRRDHRLFGFPGAFRLSTLIVFRLLAQLAVGFTDYSAGGGLVGVLGKGNLWNGEVLVLTVKERGLVLADYHHITFFQRLAELVDKLIKDVASLAASHDQ